MHHALIGIHFLWTLNEDRIWKCGSKVSRLVNGVNSMNYWRNTRTDTASARCSSNMRLKLQAETSYVTSILYLACSLSGKYNNWFVACDVKLVASYVEPQIALAMVTMTSKSLQFASSWSPPTTCWFVVIFAREWNSSVPLKMKSIKRVENLEYWWNLIWRLFFPQTAKSPK